MKLKHTVVCTAVHVEGTTIEFTCKPAGHKWREDMAYPKGKRYPYIRLSEQGVKLLTRHWAPPTGHCYAPCKQCEKAANTERVIAKTKVTRSGPY